MNLTKYYDKEKTISIIRILLNQILNYYKTAKYDNLSDEAIINLQIIRVKAADSWFKSISGEFYSNIDNLPIIDIKTIPELNLIEIYNDICNELNNISYIKELNTMTEEPIFKPLERKINAH